MLTENLLADFIQSYFSLFRPKNCYNLQYLSSLTQRSAIRSVFSERMKKVFKTEMSPVAFSSRDVFWCVSFVQVGQVEPMTHLPQSSIDLSILVRTIFYKYNNTNLEEYSPLMTGLGLSGFGNFGTDRNIRCASSWPKSLCRLTTVAPFWYVGDQIDKFDK